MGLFGGSSKSRTTQTNEQKSNSAFFEGTGLNAADGASGASDGAISILGDRNTAAILRQEGFSFSGARKSTIEPAGAALLSGAIVLAGYLYTRK